MLKGTYFKEKESRKKASIALTIAAKPQILFLKPSDFLAINLLRYLTMPIEQ